MANKKLSATGQMALALPTMHGQNNLEFGITWSSIPRSFLESDVLVQGTEETIKSVLDNEDYFQYHFVNEKLALASIDFNHAIQAYEYLTEDKSMREKAITQRKKTADAFRKFIEKLAKQPLGTKVEVGVYCTNSLPQATKLSGEKIPAFAVDFQALANLSVNILGMSVYNLVVEVGGRRLPLAVELSGIPNKQNLVGAEMTRDNNALVVVMSLEPKS
jgi:hypothetical protein